jgi:adenine deaminase
MFYQPSISTLVAAGGAKMPSTTVVRGGRLVNVVSAEIYSADIAIYENTSVATEIVFQDIPIIESQRPELLPIDLQADVHVKPDAISIAYRRWLKELGLSTGTL